MTALQRIIEHFGMSPAHYGFRPGETPTEADLRRAVRHRPEWDLFMVIRSVHDVVEGHTGAPVTFAYVRELVKLQRLTRLERIAELTEGADDVAAVAVLAITGRMSLDTIAALCWVEE